MLKQVHLKFLRGTLVGALAIGGVAACGDSDDGSTPGNPPIMGGDSNPDVSTLPPTIPGSNSGATGFDDVLGQQLAALDATQCTWVASGTGAGTYTINLSTTKNIAIISQSGTSVVVNDVPCNSAGTGAPAVADLKILNINGSTVADVVVLDYSGGFFGMGASGASNVNNGTNIDLKTSASMTNDRVLVRMRSNGTSDYVICGTSGTNHMCNVNNDNMAITAMGAEGNIVDIKKFVGVELVQFGLGDDNDTFVASGSAGLSGVAGTWGTTPFAVPLVVNGGAGDDTMTGGNGADTLLGWTGDDTINAEALKAGGNDIFSGGAGGETNGDTLSYGARTAAITVQTDTTWGTASGTDFSGESGETDRVQNDFEIYVGGAGADVFKQGADAANTYSATYRGGAGNDTVDYSARTHALTIKLAGPDPMTDETTGSGNISGGGSENDKFLSMENCIGGSGIDTVVGSADDNVIETRGGADIITAGAGNDTIVEGGVTLTGVLSGADEIDGEGGFDTISYEGRSAGVTVTLAAASVMTGNDGDAGGGGELDDVFNIERVVGTAQVDTITASGTGSVLEGLDGADVLTGGAGNDRLEGGAGADDYSGGCGAGDDTIIDADTDPTLANLATWACENKI